jgi:hypothetical protein
MNKRLEYGCSNCGHKPKKIPYGSKRTRYYCFNCDLGTSTLVNKKRERRKAKQTINEQLNDEDNCSDVDK